MTRRLRGPVSVGTYVGICSTSVGGVSCRRPRRSSSATTGAPTRDTGSWPPTPRHFGASSRWRCHRCGPRWRQFSYAQLKRSFYIWFIQQVGLAEAALVQPGFWESLVVRLVAGYDRRKTSLSCDDTSPIGKHHGRHLPLPCVVQRHSSPIRNAQDEASKTMSRHPCRRCICTVPRRSDRRRLLRRSGVAFARRLVRPSKSSTV